MRVLLAAKRHDVSRRHDRGMINVIILFANPLKSIIGDSEGCDDWLDVKTEARCEVKKTLFVPSMLASVVVTGFSACTGGNSTTAATAPSQLSDRTSIPLKLIGLIMPAHDEGPRTAVFRDSVGHVVPGREGDFIEGRYRITRIMTDAVEITDNAGRKITVPFTRDEASTSR